MREILFRGKRTDNGEWVEGNLINWNSKLEPRIIWFKIEGESLLDSEQIETNFEVKKESVGQFTGLTDKNGTKVFEGDILENAFTIKNYEDDDYHLENRYSSQYETKTCKSEVKFIKGEFRITSGVSFNNCKIIGNIHDNPELLK